MLFASEFPLCFVILEESFLLDLLSDLFCFLSLTLDLPTMLEESLLRVTFLSRYTYLYITLPVVSTTTYVFIRSTTESVFPILETTTIVSRTITLSVLTITTLSVLRSTLCMVFLAQLCIKTAQIMNNRHVQHVILNLFIFIRCVKARASFTLIEIMMTYYTSLRVLYL